MIKYINPKKHDARVCLEATGTYHFDLALRLSHQEGIEVMVLNPRIARRFSQSLNKPDKDDDVDAAVLAEYADRMEFVEWKRPSNEYITVRAYARRLSKLTEMKAQNKNQLHALEASTEYGEKAIISSVKKMIRVIEKEIETLKASAILFVQSTPELSTYFKLLLSIKGVAETSAIQLLGELLVLPKDMTYKQWVKFAGLNPCKFQSGTSVNKKSRISKAGNRYLRKALYMPAISAANNDPYVRGFYWHLMEDNGLKKMQAICAIMRKMLHAIHGMFNSKTEFDNTRFYKTPMAKRKKEETTENVVDKQKQQHLKAA